MEKKKWKKMNGKNEMQGFPAVRLHYYIRLKKGKQKNHTNYTQNPTRTLHLADYPRFTMCIVCVSNYTQTIHKPYIEAFKTLHSERSQNDTRSGFEHESREWIFQKANGIQKADGAKGADGANRT